VEGRGKVRVRSLVQRRRLPLRGAERTHLSWSDLAARPGRDPHIDHALSAIDSRRGAPTNTTEFRVVRAGCRGVAGPRKGVIEDSSGAGRTDLMTVGAEQVPPTRERLPIFDTHGPYGVAGPSGASTRSMVIRDVRHERMLEN